MSIHDIHFHILFFTTIKLIESKLICSHKVESVQIFLGDNQIISTLRIIGFATKIYFILNALAGTFHVTIFRQDQLVYCDKLIYRFCHYSILLVLKTCFNKCGQYLCSFILMTKNYLCHFCNLNCLAEFKLYIQSTKMLFFPDHQFRICFWPITGLNKCSQLKTKKDNRVSKFPDQASNYRFFRFNPHEFG